MSIVRTSAFAALLCACGFAGSAIGQDHQHMQGMDMGNMGSMNMSSDADTVKVGDLEVSGGFARPCSPASPLAAAASP
ncbi:hypothetical protein FHX06_001801 [Rhizobium sp. BK512]|nr:hypothetical protein [Rhizobium sp. BK512]